MIKNTVVNPYPLGVWKVDSGIRFTYVTESDDCGIILYNKETKEEIKRIPFTKKERIGNVYTKVIEQKELVKTVYQFYDENCIKADVYGRSFWDNKKFGSLTSEENLFAVPLLDDFEWEEDVNPQIPYNDGFIYCLHVRGFTKHSSSKVKGKGTFLGIIEKLPYLKALGVTTLELQPSYEFIEYEDEKKVNKPYLIKNEEKLNYWGYKKGYYYAPKAAYAHSKDPVKEFKELVKQCHKNNIEIVMQFYFEDNHSKTDVLDVLRFWKMIYHIDGFHIMGNALPINIISMDPMLSDAKIWSDSFSEKEKGSRLAVYKDDFLYIARKYLKGDEGMMNDILYQIRKLADGKANIHYISNYFGFTLKDLYAYDRKHNEMNDEDNRDGNDYNFSWNCGEEGETRKKKIQKLRFKLQKNALCLLMLSQSTPLLFMGDEFGNSQKGNNNPYCQDNEITWLNWRDLEKNKALFDFVKMLFEFRKKHSILHLREEARMIDYLSCGYPDISFHGENAWQVPTETYQRQVGVMFCGEYENEQNALKQDVYVTMNMHWEKCRLALPRLAKNKVWEEMFSTDEDSEALVSDNMVEISPRTIVVFLSKTLPEPKGKRKVKLNSLSTTKTINKNMTEEVGNKEKTVKEKSGDIHVI